MAQFSSRLYPQTNPTNPYLLLLREEIDLNPTIDRGYFIRELVEDMDLEDGFAEMSGTASVRFHTRRVIERLASLTG